VGINKTQIKIEKIIIVEISLLIKITSLCYEKIKKEV